MNKFVLLGLGLFMFLATVSSALAGEVNTAQMQAYYTFDDADIINVVDQNDKSSANHDLTNAGADTGSAGIFNEAYDFVLANTDYASTGFDMSTNGYDGMSVCFWFKSDEDNPSGRRDIWGSTGTNTDDWRVSLQTDGAVEVFYRGGGGSTRYLDGVDDVCDGGWHHVCSIYNDSTTAMYLYVDGVLKDTDVYSLASDWTSTYSAYIGARNDANNDANHFDGFIDEFGAWFTALTLTEIEYLYASGSPDSDQQPPFISGAPSNFTVDAVDNWDNTSLENYSVLVDGQVYGTDAGLVTTSLLENESSLYDVTVFGVNDSGGYFNKTYSNWNVSSNLQAVLHQAEIDFEAFEVFTNRSLTGNFTVVGLYNSTFFLKADNYNVTFINSSYFNRVQEFNVSAFDNKTVNVTGVYSSVLNLELKDIVTNLTVVEASYVLVEFNSTSVLYESANGNFSIGLLNETFSLTAWANNYAYYYANVTMDDLVENETFLMYSNNSLWVSAFDFDTSASLSDFTVSVYNDNKSYNFDDNNSGVATIHNVTSGVYTVKVDKTGYLSAEYPITMTGGSHQNLNAYLINESGDTTIFTIVNSISGSIIEGATIDMYKSVNSSWLLINSRDSDITGRAQFSYVSDTEYRFVVSKTGFETRTFLLEPLFSSYTVKLTPDVQEEPDLNTGSWSYFINNSGLFYDDANNSFSISISSGTGTIQYYYLNVTHPNGSTVENSCVLAGGCSDDFDFEILNADFNDSVVVEYWIKETGKSEKYFKKVYYIQDVFADDTLMNWADATDVDGMGDLEVAFISLMILLIVVGVVATTSVLLGVPPVTSSGVALALTVEILAFVGFMSFLTAHLIALGVLLIVVFGRGEL